MAIGIGSLDQDMIFLSLLSVRVFLSAFSSVKSVPFLHFLCISLFCIFNGGMEDVKGVEGGGMEGVEGGGMEGVEGGGMESVGGEGVEEGLSRCTNREVCKYCASNTNFTLYL